MKHSPFIFYNNLGKCGPILVFLLYHSEMNYEKAATSSQIYCRSRPTLRNVGLYAI